MKYIFCFILLLTQMAVADNKTSSGTDAGLQTNNSPLGEQFKQMHENYTALKIQQEQYKTSLKHIKSEEQKKQILSKIAENEELLKEVKYIFDKSMISCVLKGQQGDASKVYISLTDLFSRKQKCINYKIIYVPSV